MTEQHAQTLPCLLRQMQGAAGTAYLEQWAKVDGDFHTAIRVSANNAKLVQVAELVYPIIERVRHLHLREGSEPEWLAAETAAHQRLGGAIVAQDSEQAAQLVRALFAGARQDNVRLLRRWVAPLRRNF